MKKIIALLGFFSICFFTFTVTAFGQIDRGIVLNDSTFTVVLLDEGIAGLDELVLPVYFGSIPTLQENQIDVADRTEESGRNSAYLVGVISSNINNIRTTLTDGSTSEIDIFQVGAGLEVVNLFGILNAGFVYREDPGTTTLGGAEFETNLIAAYLGVGRIQTGPNGKITFALLADKTAAKDREDTFAKTLSLASAWSHNIETVKADFNVRAPFLSIGLQDAELFGLALETETLLTVGAGGDVNFGKNRLWQAGFDAKINNNGAKGVVLRVKKLFELKGLGGKKKGG